MDAEKLGNLLGFWLPQALGESLDAENRGNLRGLWLSNRLLGRAWTTGGTMYKKLAFYAYYALFQPPNAYYALPCEKTHQNDPPLPHVFFIWLPNPRYIPRFLRWSEKVSLGEG